MEFLEALGDLIIRILSSEALINAVITALIALVGYCVTRLTGAKVEESQANQAIISTQLKDTFHKSLKGLIETQIIAIQGRFRGAISGAAREVMVIDEVNKNGADIIDSLGYSNEEVKNLVKKVYEENKYLIEGINDPEEVVIDIPRDSEVEDGNSVD